MAYFRYPIKNIRVAIMVNKIMWKRIDGVLTPLMFERVNGRWLWVNYRSSKAYIPDKGNFSEGYLSFLNALKLGYEVVHSSS